MGMSCSQKNGLSLPRTVIYAVGAIFISAATVWAGITPSPAFDTEILKSRGIDPKLAELFSKSARFIPGREQVTVFVNGERTGRLYATFNAEGELCFNEAFLNSAGLEVPKNMIESEKYILPREINTKNSASSSHGDTPVIASKSSASNIFSYDGITKANVSPLTFWAVQKRGLKEGKTGNKDVGQCYDFISSWPQTEVDLRPGKQEIHLFVPQEALNKIGRNLSDYYTGGAAAILNYDVLTMQTHSPGSRSEFSSIDTESGLNIYNWNVRSRNNLTIQNGERTHQHLYTYAQHTFLPLKSIVQAGQIDIISPLFAGAPVTGVQLLPDTALLPEDNGGVVIEGIAKTSQARIEIKQNGLLIHSTVVPAGPFVVQNVPLLRVNTNVDVTVFESDGTQHTSSLPAASLRRVNFSARGWSVAVGKVRQNGSKEPRVVALSNDWLLGRYSLLTSGLMWSEDYLSTGVLIDSVFGQETTLTVGSLFSQADAEGKKGIQNTVALNTRISNQLTANASVTRQSRGYRDLMDTLDIRSSESYSPTDSNAFRQENNSVNNTNTQYSAGLNWYAQQSGSGGVTFVQSKSSDGDWGRILTFSWAISLHQATLSATYQKALKRGNGDTLFVNLNIPLGEHRNLQTRYSQSDDNNARLSTTYNESVSESFNYSLSASRYGDGYTNLSGNLSATPRYARLNLGYEQNRNDSRNYNMGLRGALVMHRKGLTPSPNQVQETFGIVSVGDEAGIKLRTPGGPVWTDPGGRAVVAQLSSWKDNQIEVVTNTLPHNADIDNGYRRLEVGRGSVSLIDFNIVRVRRVLLSARFPDGLQLPKGASVLDKDGHYLTTVVDNGNIFLQDAGKEALRVNLPDGKQCNLMFSLPDEDLMEGYFENATAICTGAN